MFNEFSDFVPSPAYLLGGFAYRDGEIQSGNPFPFGTSDHADWDCGWCDAAGYDDYTSGWDQGH